MTLAFIIKNTHNVVITSPKNQRPMIFMDDAPATEEKEEEKEEE